MGKDEIKKVNSIINVIWDKSDSLEFRNPVDHKGNLNLNLIIFYLINK